MHVRFIQEWGIESADGIAGGSGRGRGEKKRSDAVGVRFGDWRFQRRQIFAGLCRNDPERHNLDPRNGFLQALVSLVIWHIWILV